MKFLIQCNLLFILFFLFADAAKATSFVDQPFPDTVQEAPVIVHGRVGTSHADWSTGQDGTRRIYTFFDLEVLEVLKGAAPGNSLTMRELGGEKDGLGMQVAGSAQFSPDEDVVVFLGPRNSVDNSYDVWGMSMGKYNLNKGEDGQEYLQGAGISGSDDHVLLGGQPDTQRPQKWTLDALRRLVQAQASAPPKPTPSTNTPRTPIISPAPATGNSPLPQGTEGAAPGLQTSSTSAPGMPATGGEGHLPWLGILLGGIGIVAALVFMSRK